MLTDFRTSHEPKCQDEDANTNLSNHQVALGGLPCGSRLGVVFKADLFTTTVWPDRRAAERESHFRVPLQ